MNIKKVAGYLAVGAIFCVTAFCGLCYQKRECLQQELADKILRFHVLANSDSEADQALKLKVRDAVGGYMQEKMEQVGSLTECEAVVRNALPEITAVAEREIADNGYDYPVQAELAEIEFPVKTYGSYTFPSGSYEALEITIGEGKGHNWWCVMFPNMCFENSMYEEVDEDAKEALREVLTDEEYEAVLNSGNYRVRFKYLSFLNRFFE